MLFAYNDCLGEAPARARSAMAVKYKKCKRYNDPGHAHALTFSCFHRQPFSRGDRARQWLVDAINLARQKHDFHVWAYVVMPEHVHLVIWPHQAEYDISKILTTIKQSVSRRALLYVRPEAPHFLPRMADVQPNGRSHYRFWQRGGGHDRNLTEPTTIWAEIEYVHGNPVRRGLCRRTEDWYWSSAADYAGVRRGPVPIDVEFLPRTAQG